MHAEDSIQQPHTIYLCECKHWQSRVPRTIVHAFRTVVADYGANVGLTVSHAGFQSGAFAAAENSNVRLLDWRSFEAMLEARWIQQHCRSSPRCISGPPRGLGGFIAAYSRLRPRLVECDTLFTKCADAAT